MRRREVEILPAALKAWRDAAGRLDGGSPWSQEELAVRASKHLPGEETISPTLVALIETSKRQPSRKNAEAIAAALGVELEAIAIILDTGVEDVPKPGAAVA